MKFAVSIANTETNPANRPCVALRAVIYSTAGPGIKSNASAATANKYSREGSIMWTPWRVDMYTSRQVHTCFLFYVSTCFPNLPIMMHLWTNQAVIHITYLTHRFIRQFGLVHCRDIFLHLSGSLRAGDGTCHCRRHQYPAQSHLSHRHPCR